MADGEIMPEDQNKPFIAQKSKTGRALCKRCKQKIEMDTLRIAKIVPSAYSTGVMKTWYHLDCIFQAFAKQKKTTRKIESINDIQGWDDLTEDYQKQILNLLPNRASDCKPVAECSKKTTTTTELGEPASSSLHKDNSFRQFRKLCFKLINIPSYNEKTKLIKEFFTTGSENNVFKGNLLLWCRMLLPGAVKRIYNLQSKQLVKLFSEIFEANQEEMLGDLNQGDVALTITEYFEKSNKMPPKKNSVLTLQEVDDFLQYLTTLTREEDQMQHLMQITEKCTANDLTMIIRLIKNDLRINAGPKHILNAVHRKAFAAFQLSHDLNSIISQITSPVGTETNLTLTVGIQLLKPVLPMLARVCKSANEAIKRCPNGFYSEIKYDGERVQVHKCGSEFKYYSRKLKPVVPHKVDDFKEYIPKAFPHGKDLILDTEILMVDLESGKPLPFGTLGKHKKNACQNARVCLFVFDCIHFNGESLLFRPLKERRKILEENMVEVKNHIMLSRKEEMHEVKELESMLTTVFQLGLEGLVIKDLMSVYSPGKRAWLKIKKDYLMNGAMADTADLVVLGAWYGTGQKGGMMSVFLMGCYDEERDQWCTVTKVHTGHGDSTLAKLQNDLDMVKIYKNMSLLPNWLNCSKDMVPDFVARDPKNQPVWEITGAEFTKHVKHTADGISVRFPRVTRVRSDKDWKSATSLTELKELYKASKDTSGFTLTSATASSTMVSKSSTIVSKPMDLSYTPLPKRKAPASSSGNQILESPVNQSAASSSREQRPSTTDSTDKCSTTSTVVTTSPVTSKTVDDVVDETGKQTFKRDILHVSIQELSTEPPKKILKILRKPLPDVFVDVKLVLPPEIPTRDLLERYYIAYGGKVLPKRDKGSATHCVVTHNTKPEELVKGATNVDVGWLWDSIKHQELQDPSLYSRGM